MKSLELINNLIEVGETGNGIWRLSECVEDFKTIKQDLEVLEIIRKKRVDVYYLYTLLKNGEVDVALNRYNIYAREGALTMVELLKLKQWLEVNE